MKKYRISEAWCKIAMAHGILDMLTVILQAKVEKQGVSWARSKLAEECASVGLVNSLANGKNSGGTSTGHGMSNFLKRFGMARA